MSILSDRDIKRSTSNGDIIIQPFHEKNLGPSSYDVTLGENYYAMNLFNVAQLGIFNPYNDEHVKKFWVKKSAIEVTKQMVEIYGLKEGSKVIVIEPKQTILAHTNEFIGGVNDITTEMKCRSSYGRSCISVCKCAGFGDTGYINRWTMEIENCGPIPVFLTVGERIAQIVFIKTGETIQKYRGSYQHTHDLEKIKSDWNPEMMLPRLKYD